MDNFVTGSPDNLAHLTGNPKFLFIRHDVSNFIFVPGKVDAVMHFASPASPNPESPYGYTNLPIQTMKAGALGTHNMLGVARAHKARFLLASTSEIYGDPLEHPQRESYWGHVDPIGVRSVYDEAKRFAEALTTAYHGYHKIDTRIVRIFNTYGPRMRLDDGRVVPNFIQQALRGEPLTVYGDGSQSRCFTHVDDSVRAAVALMESDRAVGEVFNVGSSEEVTIRALAERIRRITGSGSELQLVPYEVAYTENFEDMQRRVPSLDKIHATIGFAPQYTLEETLAAVVRYHQSLRAAIPA